MVVAPSGATHYGPKTGNFFKLASLTPLKAMRWAGTKWVRSDYSRLGYEKFSLQTKKIKRKFIGNLHGTAILS